MSITIAEIAGGRCGCGQKVPMVFVDVCYNYGDAITIKQGDEWVDLTPSMMEKLIAVLTEKLSK
jgi:predicted transglutaminase-like cysteine proteinase